MRSLHPLFAAVALLGSLSHCAPPRQQLQLRVPLVRVTQPPPAPRDPGAVTLTTALSQRFVRAGASSEVLLRVRLETGQAPRGRRPAANLSVVVDTSGSMEGEALEQARAATLAALDAMEEHDHVSVVTFGSSAEVLLPSTELLDSNRTTLRARVASMRARGTTDLTSGLTSGLAQLNSHWEQGGLNRMLLLSDGVPNDPATAHSAAQSVASRGVTVTALGFGPDYDETLLGAIALGTGGRFHSVQETAQLRTVFRDEVLHLRRLVARNATLTFTTGPGVRILEVLGHGGEGDGAPAQQVSVGDVALDEPHDVFVRLAVPARRDGASIELLDTSLTFDDSLAGAGRLSRSAFVGVRATATQARLQEGADPTLEGDSMRVRVASALLRSIELARSGQTPQALASLEAAETAARASLQRQPNPELREQLEQLVRLRAALPSIQPYAQGAVAEAAMPMPAQEQLVRRLHAGAMQTLLHPR